MRNWSIPFTAFALAFLGPACERKTVVIETRSSEETVGEPIPRTDTLETKRLGSTIDDFERGPSAENNADVKKAFADLDGEIAELEARVARISGGDRDEAALKLRNLQSYRAAEQLRFTRAQAAANVSPSAIAQPPAPLAEERARKVGETIEDSAIKSGNALKDALDKAGDALKDRAP